MSPTIGDLLKVDRDDLKGFPEDTVKIILKLQKEGWRAQKSNRNHVLLLAPDGFTKIGASKNAAGAKYITQTLNKYYKGLDVNDIPKETEKVVAPEKHKCPRDNCPKVFNSLEKLSVHINVDHEGRIKCPDCDETFAKPHVMGIHRAQRHGYVSPTKARRMELKAQKEAKKEEDTLTEEQREIVDAYETEKSPLIKDHILRHADDEIKAVLDDPDILNPLAAGAENAREKGAIAGGLLKQAIINEAKNIVDDISEKRTGVEAIDEAKKLVESLDKPEVTEKSWVLDMSMIMDVTVETVMKNMFAAGLGMEIRVWKESE